MAASPADASAQRPPPAEATFTYTTVNGDTLIGLGRRFLIEPGQWPELARLNQVRQPKRMPTGTVLHIPLRLMATEAVPATVTAVSGDARVATAGAEAPLQAGQPVPPGTELRTGDGNLTVRLVDGTVLRLRAASSLQIEESLRVPKADLVRSGVRLQQGQIEVKTQPAAAGKPGFRVGTPQGALGVRGTEFRVNADEAAAATRGEVLEGAVAASGAPGQPEQRVPAGFGVVVDSTGRVAPPVPLLAAPDLTQLPALQERPLVRFSLPAQPATAGFRAQVSRDAGFEQVLAEVETSSGELRISDLPDGDYVLRVRGIDANGLQGLNSDHPFRLKARPEPPLPQAPAPGAVLTGDRVELAWTTNPDARSYRVQLSSSEDFSTPLRDLPGHPASTLSLTALPPGSYFWRLASERSATDQGPFGATSRFELRLLPAAPETPQVGVGEQALRLAWEGAPGQTFELQLARDAAFGRVVLERSTDTPALELPLPGSGRFFVRVRARDADGYTGPYSTPQQFDVPNCLRGTGGTCVRAGGQLLIIAP